MATFCSWKKPLLNVNTWSVRIGQTNVLTWQTNKMGEIATVNFNKLHKTDTLFVQRYLCGHNPEERSVTILTLKDEKGKTLAETINKDPQLLLYTGNIPLSDVLVKNKITKGELLNIYFTINHGPDEIGEEKLIGRLKLN
jgi:hypothetical protein